MLLRALTTTLALSRTLSRGHPTMTTPPSKAVDYLVVGAGASGMSFVDSLLAHASTPVSVLLLDKREAPGGHWHDAYGWCRLHQPARNYGVESRKLEDETSHPELRADRAEIISYYQTVLDGWVAKGHDVRFVGGASFDLLNELANPKLGMAAKRCVRGQQ